MEYEEREQHKQEGWTLYHSGKSLTEKAQGLLMVIEGHFFRNPEAPDFPTYASHWLWASQGRYERGVLDQLIARFPLPQKPRIQLGYSDWDSYGDPSYKLSA